MQWMMDSWRATVWFAQGYRHYMKEGFLAKQQGWDPHELDKDLSGKVFLVTGANSGLGKSTATTLARKGGKVYMLCRNQERGEEARKEIIKETGNEDVHLEVVDISLQSSIRSFAKRFEDSGERCDVLINNAGVLLSERSETSEGIETTFATNTLGPFLLTNLMMPTLEKSAPSRVIIVSSGGALTQKMDLSDPQFTRGKWDGSRAYSQTKREEIYLTEEFAKREGHRGVRFFAMHPGWADTPGVQTSLPGFHAKFKDSLRSMDEGADTINWLAISDAVMTAATSSDDDERKAKGKAKAKDYDEYNGKFFFDREVASPFIPTSRTHSSPEEVEELWQLCLRMTQPASS